MARPWSVRGSHLQHGVWWFRFEYPVIIHCIILSICLSRSVSPPSSADDESFPTLRPSWELPTWPLRLSPGVDPATYRRSLWSTTGRRLGLHSAAVLSNARWPSERRRNEPPLLRVAWFHRWVQQKRLYLRNLKNYFDRVQSTRETYRNIGVLEWEKQSLFPSYSHPQPKPWLQEVGEIHIGFQL